MESTSPEHPSLPLVSVCIVRQSVVQCASAKSIALLVWSFRQKLCVCQSHYFTELRLQKRAPCPKLFLYGEMSALMFALPHMLVLPTAEGSWSHRIQVWNLSTRFLSCCRRAHRFIISGSRLPKHATHQTGGVVTL